MIYKRILFYALCLYLPLLFFISQSLGNTVDSVTYHYTPFSQVMSRTLSNGIMARYQYNAYDNLTQLAYYKSPAQANKINQFSYRYNKNGTIQQSLTINRYGQHASEKYAYDKNNRLKDYLCSGALCPKDACSQVISRQHYLFDAFNNIKTLISNRITSYYEYNQAFPTQLIRYERDNTICPSSSILRYDYNGNMIRDGQNNVITYNPLDEIEYILNKALRKTAYLYNGDGTQVGEITHSGKAAYFIYGQNTLLTIQDADQKNSILYGLTRLGQKNQINTEYYLTDYTQSIVNIVYDYSQQLRSIDSYAYSPYGITTHLNAIKPQRNTTQYFGFNGQLTDSQTHWQFLGHGYRAYNPSLYRFIQQDSASPFDQGSINGYQFSNGNPIMLQDPSGHAAISLGNIFKTLFGLSEIMLGIGIEIASPAGIYPASNTLLIAGGWQFFDGISGIAKHQPLSIGEAFRSLGTSLIASAVGLQTELKLPRMISKVFQPILPNSVSRRLGFVTAEYLAATAYNANIYLPINYHSLSNNPLIQDLSFHTQTEVRYLSTAVLYEALLKPFTGRHIFGLLSESNLNELGIKLKNHEIRQTAYQSILKENNYKKLMNSRFYYTGRSISRNFFNFNSAFLQGYLDFSLVSSITGILAYR